MNETERFYVDTVSGWLQITSLRAREGLTAMVFDRAFNCQVVAQYRSEDQRQGHPSHQERLSRALQLAYDKACELSEWEQSLG